MSAQSRKQLLVLIVDDHPLVISGCQLILGGDPSIEVISADNEKSGFQAFASRRPDVTIVDINLPDLSGFELLRRIRKQSPEAAVIVMSMNDDPTFVLRSIELGAMGFISKSGDPRFILKAVRQVAKGETFLAPELAKAVTFSGSVLRADPKSQLNTRELEALRLLARGLKIGEMADILGISYKTVANTTTLLKQKLGARGRSDLMRIAIDMDLN
jgi:DNA-binding NarL/FixJ family response regulator